MKGKGERGKGEGRGVKCGIKAKPRQGGKEGDTVLYCTRRHDSKNGGGGSARKSHSTVLQTTVNPTPFRPRGGDPKGGFFRWLLGRVTAGRGVEKVEPGSEKILGVGLDFKIRICPAHSRSDVGLEKLRALCEAYAKRGHKKFTSDHQSLVCAYAKHM